MSWAARIVLGFGTVLLGSAFALDANAAMGSLAPRDSGTAAGGQPQWIADPRTSCRAIDIDFEPGDSITWQGGCYEGMINGAGTLSFLNNGRVIETITGTFGEGALLPGHVSAVWGDGSKYDGNQSGWQFAGTGHFLSATGDRMDGEWKSGALNGKASVVWANGDRYDGEWKDGRSDGEGTEIWANGDRYQGLWKDGKPAGQNEPPATGTNGPQPAMALAGAPAPTQMPAATPPAAVPAPATLSAGATPQHAVTETGTPPLALHDFVGRTLVAVDGSTLDVSQTEGGLSRVVTLPNGTAQQTSFAFMNDRIGTVSNETTTIGLFRTSGDEIDTNYTDGDMEVMKPGSGDGLLLTLRSADGSSVCTSWYPQGHVFSQEEKQAAVQEYAIRLGVSQPAAQKKHRTSGSTSPTCGGAFLTDVAATQPRAAGPSAPAQVSLPAAQAIRPPALPGPASDGLQTVPVKDSTVHPVDAPYDPAAARPSLQDAKYNTEPASQLPAPDTAPAAPAAQDSTNASECLSVANDGQYWGFQNRCGNVVQFVYCEMSDANPLTSCHRTSVSGSVAANGFSALVSDTSLSEQGVKHEFRWMACGGGAGEVVAHLDSFDPPSGRCLRTVPANSSTVNAAPAGS